MRRIICVPLLGLWMLAAANPPSIPGLTASTHYSTTVRKLGCEDAPISEFVFQTSAQASIHEPASNKCNGYFAHLENWTSSWVNLEVEEAPYQLTITRLLPLDAPSITSATVHPSTAGATVARINGNSVVVNIPGPCQIYVDINGAMDATNTGPDYTGPPVHAFMVFANPILHHKPDPRSPYVRYVAAGSMIPTTFSEPTLYFGPGVHSIPTGDFSNWDTKNRNTYTLLPNKSYYIPQDAWVKGALNNSHHGDQGIRIFGYGHVDGSGISRGPPSNALRCDPNNSPQGLTLSNVAGSSVYGITFVDFPNHHLILGGIAEGDRNSISHVKVLGWRANGDGLHVFQGWNVSDMFMRVQDDALYIASGPPAHQPPTIYERIKVWGDANGGCFIFGGGANTILQDSVSLYARLQYVFKQDGDGVLTQRNMSSVSNVLVQRMLFEDPLPTRNFISLWQGREPGAPAAKQSIMSNITIRDVVVNAASTVQKEKTIVLKNGLVNIIKSGPLPEYSIFNLSFANVSIAGHSMADIVHDPDWFRIGDGVTDLTVDGQPVVTG